VSDVQSLEGAGQCHPEANGRDVAVRRDRHRALSLPQRGDAKALIVLTDGNDTTSRVSYDDIWPTLRSARGRSTSRHRPQLRRLYRTAKMKALAAETGGVTYSSRT